MTGVCIESAWKLLNFGIEVLPNNTTAVAGPIYYVPLLYIQGVLAKSIGTLLSITLLQDVLSGRQVGGENLPRLACY